MHVSFDSDSSVLVMFVVFYACMCACAYTYMYGMSFLFSCHLHHISACIYVRTIACMYEFFYVGHPISSTPRYVCMYVCMYVCILLYTLDALKRIGGSMYICTYVRMSL